MLSVDADGHKTHYCALQGIIQCEGSSKPLLDVERYILKSAHVEESFELNRRQAWMVQEVAEHESSGLSMHLALICASQHLLIDVCHR